jgi:hypothetical protein
MHFHLPKPLHGWREFAGEVGIIVVGVLIALGAEQVVEGMHWQSQVAEFRKAEDSELANNLAAFRYRLLQSPCVQRRIAQLQQWGKDSRSGKTEPLNGEIGRPSVVILRSSVWSARGDALSHMPLGTRLDYSGLYDLFDNVQQQIIAEREAWRSLAAFNDVDTLSADNRMRLNELLYRVKSIDRVLRLNWAPVVADAKRLGIRPSFGQNAAFVPPPDPRFCAALFGRGPQTKGRS